MTDGPDLGALVGCQVTRVCFDHQVTLLLAGAGHPERVDASLVVESPMSLTAGGSTVRVDPDTATNLAAVLALLHRRIASVDEAADGTLRLGFGGGDSLAVHPDPPYESWSLTGDGVPNRLAGPS